MVGALAMSVLFAALLVPAVAEHANGLPNGTCFSNAIPEADRKNLTTAQQESIPFTFLLASWTSAQVTSSVIEILASEIMGYNVAVDPQVPASSVDGIYALLGCSTWWNGTSCGCEDRKIKAHVMVDSWYRLCCTHNLQEVQEKYKEEAPKHGGNMGYLGDAGAYVSEAPRVSAKNTSGLALEYYQSHDANWFTPSQYFSSLSTVNTSDFMGCDASLLSDNQSIYNYLMFSGDSDGVNITTTGNVTSYKAYCPDNIFWRSTSCRTDVTKCVPFVTGGDGWDTLPMLQRSAAYNMPIAFGVAANYGKYLSAPKEYTSLFYWWTPDDSFIQLKPTQVLFPPNNAYEWSQSIYTTGAVAVPVVKLNSYDISSMSPTLAKLVLNSELDLDAVNSMMLDKVQNSLTREQAACAWLKSNEDRWKGWIPVPTTCESGFGLYDEVSEAFVGDRASATTCRACLPGMFSKALVDEGPTHICEACPAGQQQLGAGAVSCNACPTGTSKAVKSTEECAPCPAGSYQNEIGALVCKACPAGTTTMILGTKQLSGCGCKAGTIDVSDLNSADRISAECSLCTEGLTCPVMSTVEALRSGSSPNGEDFTPALEEGYFSSDSDPTEIFKCFSRFECPGGMPGTCGGNSKGIPCGNCPADTYWGGSKCSDCSAWSVIGWILSIVIVFAGLVLAYYFLNAAVTAKASTLFSTTCAIGMMINMLQSLGIVGTMTVEWPVNMAGIFDFLQVFTFDIDSFAFACFAGENPVARYVGLVLFFPAGLLWLQGCGLISKIKPSWAWSKVKLRSTMGQFMQVAFSTMSSTALVPMICYTHPNGQQSNLKYPNVFCGSDEHMPMLIAGWLLLAFGVCGFWTFAAWLAYMAPTFSSKGKYEMVQSSRFLLGRFRLDVWWYGVPLLLRGPLLAMTVVLAPDAPALQCLGCQIILMTFMVVQIYNWPWKAPILNVVDMVVCFLLAILVVVAGFFAPPAAGDVLEILNGFSLAVLACLVGVVGIMILCALLALVYRQAIGSQNELKIMTVGNTPPPAEISEQFYQQILSLQAKSKDHLTEKLAQLGVYDLQALKLAVGVLQSEVVEVAEISSGIVSKHSSSRITSRALAPKAKAQAKAEKDVETEKPESLEEPKEHNNVFLDDQAMDENVTPEALKQAVV